jgi:hypothetical protein
MTENARLSAMVGSQGGLTVGSFTFPSIEALAEVIDRELTGVYPWDIFVDVATMHIHNANVDPENAASLMDWNKATKEMAGTYSVAQRKYVCAIIQPVSSLYTDGKEVFREEWPRPSRPQPLGLDRMAGMDRVTRSRIRTTQPGWLCLRRSMRSWLAAQFFMRLLYTWWKGLHRTPSP